jgi:hypothetical protein
MTNTSQTSGLSVYFTTPSYNSAQFKLTVTNVQVLGGVGTVYFVLVLYKQISVNATTKSTTVNIRMNQAPTATQILNCQNWLGQTAEGCARAVYTGVAPLTVSFTPVLQNSLYLLYYVVASEFPLRPIANTKVSSTTIVTYLSDNLNKLGVLLLLFTLTMII